MARYSQKNRDFSSDSLNIDSVGEINKAKGKVIHITLHAAKEAYTPGEGHGGGEEWTNGGNWDNGEPVHQEIGN